MVDGTKTARMTVDWHVVGRVGKGHRSTSLTHQLHTGVVVAGITAQDAMQAEKPQIAELAHSSSGRPGDAQRALHCAFRDRAPAGERSHRTAARAVALAGNPRLVPALTAL